MEVFFQKRVIEVQNRGRTGGRLALDAPAGPPQLPNLEDSLRTWLACQSEAELFERETEALDGGFGSELERRIVLDDRERNVPILSSGRIRRQYVRRCVESMAMPTPARIPA